MTSHHKQTPKDYQKSIKNLSFLDKYSEWLKLLDMIENKKLPELNEFYDEFLENFPFNHTLWNKYAQIVAGTGNDEALKIYERSVEMNPRSLDLWNCYSSWVVYIFGKSDHDLVERVYDKAIECVGHDYNSFVIWDFYLNFLIGKKNKKAHEVFIRVAQAPINKLEIFSTRYRDFLIILTHEEVQKIYDANFSEELVEDPRAVLSRKFDALYEKTKHYLAARRPYEEYIKRVEFDQYSYQEADIWEKYISSIKDLDNLNLKRFIFEKALITQCANSNMWFEFFDFLESNNLMAELLNVIAKYKVFFMNFDVKILYHWADLEEGFSPEKVRTLLAELEEHDSLNLQPYIRHLEFEMRQKDYESCKAIFAHMLSVFKTHPEVLSFVLKEYTEFIKKHCPQDKEHLRKTLKDNFESCTYTRNMFAVFLKGYATENSAELEETIELGLAKALQISEQEMMDCMKISKNFIRSSIEDITTIRNMEKKQTAQKLRDKHAYNYLQNEVLKKKNDYDDERPEEERALKFVKTH